ncbi:hypothetical protein PENFLA_c007G09566 [Penicillium flavigenum]|uniref:7-dehydrocholesterol reductase n=1 Tax=Penicillium flavigenum TaxID=254877 RepID=A0A1V6THW4_9EURO|nr:hypothetical protein PENFLA_c007G09566 [Penicillium flavigenum]
MPEGRALTTTMVAQQGPCIYRHGKDKDEKDRDRKKYLDSDSVLWGRRRHVSMLSGLLSLGFVIAVQLLVIFLCSCLYDYDGSIQQGILGLLSSLSDLTPSSLFRICIPRIERGPTLGCAAWVGIQAILYSILPGKIVHGPPTPGGNTLPYQMNGMLSWGLSLGMVAIAWYIGGVEVVSSAARNWKALLAAASMYGILMSLLMLVKGYYWPSYPKDRRFSYSIFHDFLSGVELNPRLGKYWDVKQFQIARLGMNSWLIVDISFVALQYERFGAISNSMYIVIILHIIYLADFFINEDWYLATIDIAHDHFGFSLGWGPVAWLPMIYTSQAQYLALHPVYLSSGSFCAILGTGIFGYWIFRLANHEKHLIRQTKGQCLIAGKKPRVIESQYITGKGDVHKSLLLSSGM